MVDSKKLYLLKNENPDQERVLTQTFITKYSHAAQIYIDEKTGMPIQSHVGTKYGSGYLRPSDLITGDVFRIDILKLISPENQQKLEEFYKQKILIIGKKL
ncbi:hypothetical protein [Legionella tunisiensis]|uniref:hypothetical protein n=1 Tax=Legionella tunisiensis TaxID=1034944 RepID=UPI0002D34613|nr:hypothetical protein [Legionella tunisiensis]